MLVPFLAVLCSFWSTGIIPTDCKRVLVVPFCEGKGDRQDCNTKISNLDFTDDAVIFAETLDILLGALEVLNEESSCWDYGFPGSKLRSRLSMTLWMLLSCLYRLWLLGCIIF